MSRQFVHLHTHSPFSFLDGATGIETLVAETARFGMSALALTDHNTIAGLPELHKWAAVYGIKPISGAELTLEDGSHLTVLAENQEGYINLCRLLTLAHHGEERRRQPLVPEFELFQHREGLIVFSGCRRGRVASLLLQHQEMMAVEVVKSYQDTFPNSFFLEIQADAYPQSDWLNRQLAEISKSLQIPLVATSNVHYATQEQFPVHDVLTCMRLGCDIHTPHAQRPLNNVRWLHDAAEARRRFSQYQAAVQNTQLIAERCQVVLRLHTSLFPAYPLVDREVYEGLDKGLNRGSTTKELTPVELLRRLVYEGANKRYPRVDQTLRQRLEHELTIIEQLGYVDYFLVVWDIVHFARKQRIRCAGRGSAADSAVAYCLYITDVDAAGRGLLFERFMSLERAEKPDIDIDFDSTRRDEVIDYVYQKYGSNHVARVATYQTFRGRSAIREVGKVLALPPQVLDQLAKRVPWMAHADSLESLFEKLPELRELSPYQEQLRWLWELSAQIAGFPRHFGMHVGGIIISSRPLLETTSLQPSAKGEWMTPFDKDAVEEVGLVKLDLLSLRTMGAIEGTVILRERAGHVLDYDSISLDNTETFAMIGRGDTIGVFQLESPAQRSLQARLQAESLEDIVASVALIRPGPIKGNMVDPFLARRKGQEAVSYLHPKLEPILGKTYGVVLFQEQVIEIATAIANFTPGEADQLRRVMSHARSTREMENIGKQFLEKAMATGVDGEVARTIFSYIQGYASYGFCEAHAAAFATTAYKTAYLVQYYPAEFYASILNQYPMGYYPVHVIGAEARRRGIAILGVDINASDWDCKVLYKSETPIAIRLGLRMLKGFRQQLAMQLAQERKGRGEFQSVLSTLRRVRALDSLSAERLIRVGAFDSVAPLQRRHLLWQLPYWVTLRDAPEQPLFQEEQEGDGEDRFGALDDNAVQRDFSLEEKLRDEYNLLGIGISGHWMDLLREWVEGLGCRTIAEVVEGEDGQEVCSAGLVVRPHRPPTKSGKIVVFFTLEDETGLLDATVFESTYQESGGLLFTPYGRLVGVEGVLQRREGTRPQLLVKRIFALR